MLKSKMTAVILIGALSLTTANAAYQDVNQEDKVLLSALERLEELEIVKGYPDGNFYPDSNITRAEAAVMARRLMNPDNSQGNVGGYILNSEGVLEEMGRDYWAMSEISLLERIGVISGYEDGSIKPERNVTYNECIKILVCMLGYNDDAIEKGGWSEGYIKCAEEIGLLKDVIAEDYSEFAPRADVAIMVNNALTIPRKLVSVCDVKKSMSVDEDANEVQGIADEMVEGITFEEILTNKNLYVENALDESINGKEFSEEIFKIDMVTLIDFKVEDDLKESVSIDVDGGSMTLHFKKINKACDYYISIDPEYDSKYYGKLQGTTAEEMSQFAINLIPPDVTIGPISTDAFTFKNIPRGTYQIFISSAPCYSNITGTAVFEGAVFDN